MATGGVEAAMDTYEDITYAGGMTMFIAAIVLAMVVVEAKDNTLTKWLRKTQDVGRRVPSGGIIAGWRGISGM